jgi:uncharacterized protein (TIGR03067 family)
MRSHAVVVLMSSLLFAAHGPQANAGQKELEKIQGTWIAVAQEANGWGVTDAEMKSKVGKGFNFVWVIKGDKLTRERPNTDFKREMTIALDSTKTPNEITVTQLDGPHKGESKRAIYLLEKDFLKVCVNKDKHQLPTGFTTKVGDGLRVLVLRRHSPESETAK